MRDYERRIDVSHAIIRVAMGGNLIRRVNPRGTRYQAASALASITRTPQNGSRVCARGYASSRLGGHDRLRCSGDPATPTVMRRASAKRQPCAPHTARMAAARPSSTRAGAGRGQPPSPPTAAPLRVAPRPWHQHPTPPRHLLPVKQPGDKLQPFIHGFTRLPGHLALPAKGPIV